MIKTAREAIAQFLGWEISELKDYRYHAGRTSLPVYSCNEYVYCATKTNPAKYLSRGTDQSHQFEWNEVKESYINSFGWKIYRANS